MQIENQEQPPQQDEEVPRGPSQQEEERKTDRDLPSHRSVGVVHTDIIPQDDRSEIEYENIKTRKTVSVVRGNGLDLSKDNSEGGDKESEVSTQLNLNLDPNIEPHDLITYYQKELSLIKIKFQDDFQVLKHKPINVPENEKESETLLDIFLTAIQQIFNTSKEKAMVGEFEVTIEGILENLLNKDSQISQEKQLELAKVIENLKSLKGVQSNFVKLFELCKVMLRRYIRTMKDPQVRQEQEALLQSINFDPPSQPHDLNPNMERFFKDGGVTPDLEQKSIISNAKTNIALSQDQERFEILIKESEALIGDQESLKEQLFQISQNYNQVHLQAVRNFEYADEIEQRYKYQQKLNTYLQQKVQHVLSEKEEEVVKVKTDNLVMKQKLNEFESRFNMDQNERDKILKDKFKEKVKIYKQKKTKQIEAVQKMNDQYQQKIEQLQRSLEMSCEDKISLFQRCQDRQLVAEKKVFMLDSQLKGVEDRHNDELKKLLHEKDHFEHKAIMGEKEKIESGFTFQIYQQQIHKLQEQIEFVNKTIEMNIDNLQKEFHKIELKQKSKEYRENVISMKDANNHLQEMLVLTINTFQYLKDIIDYMTVVDFKLLSGGNNQQQDNLQNDLTQDEQSKGDIKKAQDEYEKEQQDIEPSPSSKKKKQQTGAIDSKKFTSTNYVTEQTKSQQSVLKGKKSGKNSLRQSIQEQQSIVLSPFLNFARARKIDNSHSLNIIAQRNDESRMTPNKQQVAIMAGGDIENSEPRFIQVAESQDMQQSFDKAERLYQNKNDTITLTPRADDQVLQERFTQEQESPQVPFEFYLKSHCAEVLCVLLQIQTKLFKRCKIANDTRFDEILSELKELADDKILKSIYYKFFESDRIQAEQYIFKNESYAAKFKQKEQEYQQLIQDLNSQMEIMYQEKKAHQMSQKSDINAQSSKVTFQPHQLTKGELSPKSPMKPLEDSQSESDKEAKHAAAKQDISETQAKELKKQKMKMIQKIIDLEEDMLRQKTKHEKALSKARQKYGSDLLQITSKNSQEQQDLIDKARMHWEEEFEAIMIEKDNEQKALLDEYKETIQELTDQVRQLTTDNQDMRIKIQTDLNGKSRLEIFQDGYGTIIFSFQNQTVTVQDIENTLINALKMEIQDFKVIDELAIEQIDIGERLPQAALTHSSSIASDKDSDFSDTEGAGEKRKFEIQKFLVEIKSRDKVELMMKNIRFEMQQGKEIFKLNPLYVGIGYGYIPKGMLDTTDEQEQLRNYQCVKKDSVYVHSIEGGERFMNIYIYRHTTDVNIRIIAYDTQKSKQYNLELDYDQLMLITDGISSMLQEENSQDLAKFLTFQMLLIKNSDASEVIIIEQKLFVGDGQFIPQSTSPPQQKIILAKHDKKKKALYQDAQTDTSYETGVIYEAYQEVFRKQIGLDSFNTFDVKVLLGKMSKHLMIQFCYFNDTEPMNEDSAIETMDQKVVRLCLFNNEQSSNSSPYGCIKVATEYINFGYNKPLVLTAEKIDLISNTVLISVSDPFTHDFQQFLIQEITMVQPDQSQEDLPDQSSIMFQELPDFDMEMFNEHRVKMFQQAFGFESSVLQFQGMISQQHELSTSIDLSKTLLKRDLRVLKVFLEVNKSILLYSTESIYEVIDVNSSSQNEIDIVHYNYEYYIQEPISQHKLLKGDLVLPQKLSVQVKAGQILNKSEINDLTTEKRTQIISKYSLSQFKFTLSSENKIEVEIQPQYQQIEIDQTQTIGNQRITNSILLDNSEERIQELIPKSQFLQRKKAIDIIKQKREGEVLLELQDLKFKIQKGYLKSLPKTSKVTSIQNQLFKVQLYFIKDLTAVFDKSLINQIKVQNFSTNWAVVYMEMSTRGIQSNTVHYLLTQRDIKQLCDSDLQIENIILNGRAQNLSEMHGKFMDLVINSICLIDSQVLFSTIQSKDLKAQSKCLMQDIQTTGSMSMNLENSEIEKYETQLKQFPINYQEAQVYQQEFLFQKRSDALQIEIRIIECKYKKYLSYRLEITNMTHSNNRFVYNFTAQDTDKPLKILLEKVNLTASEQSVAKEKKSKWAAKYDYMVVLISEISFPHKIIFSISDPVSKEEWTYTHATEFVGKVTDKHTSQVFVNKAHQLVFDGFLRGWKGRGTRDTFDKAELNQDQQKQEFVIDTAKDKYLIAQEQKPNLSFASVSFREFFNEGMQNDISTFGYRSTKPLLRQIRQLDSQNDIELYVESESTNSLKLKISLHDKDAQQDEKTLMYEDLIYTKQFQENSSKLFIQCIKLPDSFNAYLILSVEQISANNVIQSALKIQISKVLTSKIKKDADMDLVTVMDILLMDQSMLEVSIEKNIEPRSDIIMVVNEAYQPFHILMEDTFSNIFTSYAKSIMNKKIKQRERGPLLGRKLQSDLQMETLSTIENRIGSAQKDTIQTQGTVQSQDPKIKLPQPGQLILRKTVQQASKLFVVSIHAHDPLFNFKFIVYDQIALLQTERVINLEFYYERFQLEQIFANQSKATQLCDKIIQNQLMIINNVETKQLTIQMSNLNDYQQETQISSLMDGGGDENKAYQYDIRFQEPLPQNILSDKKLLKNFIKNKQNFRSLSELEVPSGQDQFIVETFENIQKKPEKELYVRVMKNDNFDLLLKTQKVIKGDLLQKIESGKVNEGTQQMIQDAILEKQSEQQPSLFGLDSEDQNRMNQILATDFNYDINFN